MKGLTVASLYCCLLHAVTAVAAPVIETRVWTERFPVDAVSPALSISNIWGNVRVRAGASGEISITVDERRSAPSRELFERSRLMLDLRIAADNLGVAVTIGDAKRDFGPATICRGCRVDYQFEVTVPTGTKLDVATVMDGTIDVAGVAGEISANNVNGPINAREVSNCQSLESVNGQVNVSFAIAPGKDCVIDTVNGDIVLSLPAGSGIDVSLDSFNGRVLSDFDIDPLTLPATVEQANDANGRRYRIQRSAGVRLAGGGPMFSLSSLNGDIRIQQSN